MSKHTSRPFMKTYAVDDTIVVSTHGQSSAAEIVKEAPNAVPSTRGFPYLNQPFSLKRVIASIRLLTSSLSRMMEI